MFHMRHAMLTVSSVLIAGTAMAAPATTNVTKALSASSSAAALNFSFSVSGDKASLTNQVFATGSAPPAYNKKTALPTYSKTVKYSDGLTLKVTTKAITDIASSTGTTAAGGITASASSTISALNSTVSTVLGAAITASASKILSKASFATIKSGKVTPTGSVSITGLSFSAPAFDVKTVTFSGAATPNKVLYESSDKSVVVYANRQVTTKSAGKTTGITVDAIALHVTNYKYGPYTITGDLALGTCVAK
jgi:hypothetical protein